MVHQLNGHEFEQAPGDGEGQGSLACCSPWSHEESDVTDRLSKLVLVAQSCPTLCNPTDCSLPVSCVHEIFQARTLEWGAISFSRGSSQPSKLLMTVTSLFTDKAGNILVAQWWRICLQWRRCRFGKVPWRRKQQPTLVFLPGKSGLQSRGPKDSVTI